MTPVTPTRWMSEVGPQTRASSKPVHGTPLIGPRRIAAGVPVRLLNTTFRTRPNRIGSKMGAQRPTSVLTSVYFAAAQGPSVNPAFVKTPKNLSAMSKRHRQDQPCLPLSGGRSSQIFFRLALLRILPPHLGNQMCSAGAQFTLWGTAGLDK